MSTRFLVAIALFTMPLAAHAESDETFEVRSAAAVNGIPAQLDDAQRAGYRAVFASIRAGRWSDAQIQLDSMKPGPLHAIARAEYYLAPGSPKIPLLPLQAWLAEAPELPQADRIARLARIRGAESLPDLPDSHRLVWHNGAPNRIRLNPSRSDAAAVELAEAMKPYIEGDRGRDAEALLASRADELTPEARTEWQQRVAWIYYLAGDDASARRMAAKAQRGTGEFVPQADWVQGLAAWRQQDWAGAQSAFQLVAEHATDVELRSAGLYWASRADIASGRPDLVQRRLLNAAQYSETFYGMLARQALGILDTPDRDPPEAVANAWATLRHRPNICVAAALMEIGEDELAAEVIRHQARIGPASEYAALTRLAGKLNLPQTQLWLSHYSPSGTQPVMAARYPVPDWRPDGGWRVDKALVYAHALQESKFDTDVVSPAGAYGLMQIMPAAAVDIGRARGVTIDRSALSRPSTNMEVGQSYLEKLRDLPATGGLLPKVIAAYNAGPSPVEAWNLTTRDGGDPLLYIESIPYWETRGYVMTVLRNYWKYQAKEGKPSASRAALAEGLWPKFPGLPGTAAVRVGARQSGPTHRAR